MDPKRKQFLHVQKQFTHQGQNLHILFYDGNQEHIILAVSKAH